MVVTFMIGVLKIVNQDEIFQKDKLDVEEHQYLSENIKESLKSIELNLDTIRIIDFIEYIACSNFSKVILIINKKSIRLENLVEYIKKNYYENIFLFDNEKKQWLDIEAFPINYNFSFTNKINVKKRLDNSKSSIYSGFYNYFDHIHIKHLVIDNLETIKRLDTSLLLHMGVNSLILYNTKSSDVISFSKIMKKKVFLMETNGYNFTPFDYNSLNRELMEFQKSGFIPQKVALMSDLGKYTKRRKLHSIFIENDSIFFDSSLKIKITNDLTKTAYDLANDLTSKEIEVKINDNLIREYFTMISLTYLLKENLHFITPFNKFFLHETIMFNNENIYLGYKKKDKYYLFNKSNNKINEVSELFIKSFESLLKSRR